MTRQTRSLTRSRDVIDRVVRRWPTSLAHAASVTADGFPLRGETGGGRSSSTTTTVEAAALARTLGQRGGVNHPALVAEFDALVRRVAADVDRLDVITLLLTPPSGGATPRCSGGMGLDGSAEWGDPTCERVPDGRPGRAGLCDACYMRSVRWAARVGAA
jgi:hypothetical protein